MRPFKIPQTNRWVDLDTIQSIDEPVLHHGMVLLRWHHASREAFDQVEFMAWTKTDGMPQRPEESHTAWIDRRDAAKCVPIRRDVFVPFFKAWTAKKEVDI